MRGLLLLSPSGTGAAFGVPKLYLDPCTATLAHCIGHCSSGRVDHGDEPHEAKVSHGEVNFICIKLESLGESVRQVQVAEPWRETERTSSP